jgi:type II secretory pathway predicted ATPase ExeA
MHKKLLAVYGLKYNPFYQEIPTEAIFLSPKVEDFFWKIEEMLLPEGGFALVHGEPGTGKSVILRALAEKLQDKRETLIGVITRPSANLSDFYRELAELFGISLQMNNRWVGFEQ